MWGYGDIAGAAPASSWTPATTVAHFGLGWGSPDPDDLFDAAGGALTWSGTEITWGYGDPSALAASQILWSSSRYQPDDGGEIIELRGDWPSIGPWTIRPVQRHTGQIFGACRNPVPGFGTRCYANLIEVEEAGSIVTKAGDRLRFVLPVLPTGVYDLRVELVTPALLGGSISLDAPLEVWHRRRCLETHAYRRRLPSIFATGTRDISRETLLGVHPDADADEVS